MTSLAERVAGLALSTFESLPRKCKPRTFADGGREWTPMAALILAEAGDDRPLTCVSLATGTKCLAASALPTCRGTVLHDCHAEILALRGFNWWLLAEVQKIVEDPAYQSPFLESEKEYETDHQQTTLSTPLSTPGAPFRLKPTISIHFFTTEAPCGDASMEILMNSLPPDEAAPWPVRENASTALQGRGHFSLLGHVRRKPARADAEPSLSKSCTDKLALKQFTGIISFPADLFVQRTANAFIRTVVVYANQYNSTGYERAFASSGRLSSLSHLGHFFSIESLPPEFSRFPFSKDDRSVDSRTQTRLKASNLSALWVNRPGQKKDDVLEVLVNGVKQGYKQWDERPAKASVASRRRLWEHGVKIAKIFPQNQGSRGEPDDRIEYDVEWHKKIDQVLSIKTYCAAKSTTLRSSYVQRKKHVTEALCNWTDNRGDDEWSLC
ncbi:hypothetical protein A1O3_07509 [Capronia epimyces CBS 606.96]|uniref:A to I editase domain-containing protein n=1 Tax=Capronia epimyces CBS 606.96 TaxID=1182542 RepID=W9YFZ8_9EURO|nr:uncharacterized protein A1O3_07509 [Capronia epimyces CBS 606.96]EXJ81219.1 hypothetical protein A1O3_07509 [Capronia epimyces CBS 606.96]